MENPKHSVLTPLITPALEMSDNELFWQANWKKFLAVLLVVVALIFLSGGWMWWTTSVRNAAESLYSQASTPEDWRGVVEKFPGSVPAGNAQLRLAAALRGEDNLDGAVECLASIKVFLCLKRMVTKSSKITQLYLHYVY